MDLRSRRTREGQPETEESDPEARMLDLRKAYPRVSKPALWGLLKRYGLWGSFLDTVVDLHETTEYKVRGREENSKAWVPERGLKECCSTSPVLFNIFLQAVMRIAEEKRRDTVLDENNPHPPGVRWR